MARFKAIGVMAGCALMCGHVPVYAQVPSSADVGRVDTRTIQIPSNTIPQADNPSGLADGAGAPSGAEDIKLTISAFDVRGVTAFDDATIAAITAPYANREITLDQLWYVATLITSYYRNEGYFLTRSFVPAQETENGATVVINVVEGRINAVRFDDPIADHKIVKSLLQELGADRVANVARLESVLLRLNDIPGVSVRAVMSPSKEKGAANVELLRTDSKNMKASIEFNNHGSRFLGPYQAIATASASVAPFHDTQAYLSASVPWDELVYAGVDHKWVIAPNWSLSFSASHVDSEPGFTLEPNNIKGQSTALGLGVRYQAIRQRRENLAWSLFMEGKNVNTDILGTTLTRDRVRALRGIVDYDVADEWDGYNVIRATLSRGIGVVGSSDVGDLNLSRAAVDPDFTSLHVSYVRQQLLGSELLMVGQAQGQWASDPLFSSEEIGYGGQVFGRAYDPSEIAGDHGVMGSLELRYLGFDSGLEWAKAVNATPYAFYDAGKVWNRDPGARGGVSAMSAGAGVRMSHDSGISGELGVAFPITKPITNPIYGNGSQPRLIMNVGMDF